MNDEPERQVSALRDHAQHYRRIACRPTAWPLAQKLDTLAEECDRAASRLLAERWQTRWSPRMLPVQRQRAELSHTLPYSASREMSLFV
jgi:hypothetical protein